MFKVNESTGGRCGTNGTMVDVSVCTQHTAHSTQVQLRCGVLRVHYPRSIVYNNLDTRHT